METFISNTFVGSEHSPAALLALAALRRGNATLKKSGVYYVNSLPMPEEFFKLQIMDQQLKHLGFQIVLEVNLLYIPFPADAEMAASFLRGIASLKGIVRYVLGDSESLMKWRVALRAHPSWNTNFFTSAQEALPAELSSMPRVRLAAYYADQAAAGDFSSDVAQCAQQLVARGNFQNFVRDIEAVLPTVN